MAGAWSTVSVKVCSASGVIPLAAVMLSDISAAAPGGRCPAERRRPVAVVEEGDAAGQGAALAQASGREAGGGDRERPRAAHRKRRAVVAGDRGGLIDGEGEGLRGLELDAVRSGEAQRIGAAAATGGRSTQRRRAVLIVHEAHTAGQGAALAEGGVGKTRTGDRERAGVPTVNVVSLSLVMAGA